MLTMRIKGGLGNQLFQYAAVYALSKRLKQPFQFDLSFTSNMTRRGYKLNQLKVINSNLVGSNQLPNGIKLLRSKYINKICRIIGFDKIKYDNYLYWLETRDEWQDDFFHINAENIYIDGYFQSEDYFKDYRGDLLTQFMPSYNSSDDFLNSLDNIVNSNSVAIHVRQGDFKSDGHPFHYILESSYYANAIEFIKKRVYNPKFYWFSNDMDWVFNNFGISDRDKFIKINGQYADIDELMLMKNCKHVIAANSTYSWWGAWLNENNPIIVVPKKPYGMDRMIPKGWIKM